ncbi:hypothetical protein GWK47_035241 [Chionoecetes opilio]|uniref:HAT C-terminal dimerisation domain-containing protein n=1 Tax=Chionoecetes opilio TaxID=41210 RepID=A0A8J5CZK1_CHIOP|nr:hypothetical protein GWK47_035241 [Chionoecetes opilio]
MASQSEDDCRFAPYPILKLRGGEDRGHQCKPRITPQAELVSPSFRPHWSLARSGPAFTFTVWGSDPGILVKPQIWGLDLFSGQTPVPSSAAVEALFIWGDVWADETSLRPRIRKGKTNKIKVLKDNQKAIHPRSRKAKQISKKVSRSAPVERLFSMGSDVLRAKRSSLTAKNFEMLIFMKGNLKMLNMRKLKRQEEEVPDTDN